MPHAAEWKMQVKHAAKYTFALKLDAIFVNKKSCDYSISHVTSAFV